jgi:hypothetical protein
MGEFYSLVPPRCVDGGSIALRNGTTLSSGVIHFDACPNAQFVNELRAFIFISCAILNHRGSRDLAVREFVIF